MHSYRDVAIRFRMSIFVSQHTQYTYGCFSRFHAQRQKNSIYEVNLSCHEDVCFSGSNTAKHFWNEFSTVVCKTKCIFLQFLIFFAFMFLNYSTLIKAERQTAVFIILHWLGNNFWLFLVNKDFTVIFVGK